MKVTMIAYSPISENTPSFYHVVDEKTNINEIKMDYKVAKTKLLAFKCQQFCLRVIVSSPFDTQKKMPLLLFYSKREMFLFVLLLSMNLYKSYQLYKTCLRNSSRLVILLSI